MNLVLVGTVAFGLSYLVVEMIRRWAIRRKLFDIPNERSSHGVPTARGGGLAIAGIVVLGFGLSRVWQANLAPLSLFGYWLGVLLVIAVSIVDDVFSLSAKVRLPVHFLAAVVFAFTTGFVDRVYFPLIGEVNLGWWGLPITLVWLVGLTNAYNFMDGIDGIAAGQAIVAGTFWLVVAWLFDMPALMTLAILVVGASLGFLVHNLPPARIFMGDVGSTTLGFTFAAFPILMFSQTHDAHSFIAGVLCVAPFVFDSVVTIVRRALNHENVLQPHRSHLYQRLVKLGYQHTTVTALYAVLALFASLMGLIYLRRGGLESALAVSFVLVVLVVTAIEVNRLERRRVRKDSQTSNSVPVSK